MSTAHDPVSQPPWTAKTVKEQLLISNAQLDKDTAEGRQREIGTVKGEADLQIRYANIAEKMGLHPVPRLYVAPSTDNIPDAASYITKEGTPYIKINQALLTSLTTDKGMFTPREATAVITEELAQYRNGYITPASLARALNDPAVAYDMKFHDDQVATGPLGTCDPRGLESALGKYYGYAEKNYLRSNPGKTPDDFKKLYEGARTSRTIYMPEHPTVEQRQERLEHQAQNPPVACIGKGPAR